MGAQCRVGAEAGAGARVGAEAGAGARVGSEVGAVSVVWYQYTYQMAANEQTVIEKTDK